MSILKEVSDELHIPYKVIEGVWKSPWGFMVEQMKNLNLNKDYTEKEFNELCTSFFVGKIGTFRCDWNRYKGKKKQEEYKQQCIKSKA